MKIRLTLKPGHPGTRKELKKYGGRLVAVRYRYDERQRLRLKTVELIEEEISWVPSLPANRDPLEVVLVRVNYDETSLREAVKLHGGRWLQDRKLWSLSVGMAYKLGLDNRIVREGPTP